MPSWPFPFVLRRVGCEWHGVSGFFFQKDMADMGSQFTHHLACPLNYPHDKMALVDSRHFNAL